MSNENIHDISWLDTLDYIGLVGSLMSDVSSRPF